MSGFDVNSIQNLIDTVTTRSADEGAQVSSSIEFRYNDEAGVGVFAKEPIPSGKVLITVPFNQCISAESVMETAIGKEIISIRPGLLQYQDEVMALGLMYAVTLQKRGRKDENSALCPWIEHVNTLPTTYNTPLYWSEEELQELKGYNTYHLTNLMKKQIAGDWKALHLPLSEEYKELLGEATLELYQWALSTVYSRAVGIVRKVSASSSAAAAAATSTHLCNSNILCRTHTLAHINNTPSLIPPSYQQHTLSTPLTHS